MDLRLRNEQEANDPRHYYKVYILYLVSEAGPRNLRLAHSLPLVDALLTSNWSLEKGREQTPFQANVQTKTVAPVFAGIKSVIVTGLEYFLDLFLNIKWNQRKSCFYDPKAFLCLW